MNQKKALVAAVLLILLFLGFLWWQRSVRKRSPAPELPAVVPPAVQPAAPKPEIAAPNPSPMKPAHPAARVPISAPPPVKPSVPPISRPIPGVPVPPPSVAGAQPGVRLHKELIPKNIKIVRCYYEKEIVGPPAVFGFDIDGSGFNADFQKMIDVDAGVDEVGFRNLKLVTANQIHGEVVVGGQAKTQYVYPKVLIQNLPVFNASDPFGVVRKGEVLAVKILDVAQDGRSEKFRVITNIDENMFKQFWVESTKSGLEVSGLAPAYPFFVDGTLSISNAQKGEYGMVVTLFSKEIFRRNDIRVVLPNLGKNGLVTGVAAVNPFRRPGDEVDFYVTGTGFRPDDAQLLTAEGIGINLGDPKIIYDSPTQIELEFKIPAGVQVGNYGITVEGSKFETLVQEKNAFTIVPPLWVDGLLATPSPSPGKKTTLKLTGREFTADFAKSIHAEMDDPGIHVSDFSLADPSTLTALADIDAGVAPGDYVVHLSAQGDPLALQFGNVIRVSTQ